MKATSEPPPEDAPPHPTWGRGERSRSWLLTAGCLAVASGLCIREGLRGGDGLTPTGVLVLLAAVVGALEGLFQLRLRSPLGLATAITRGGALGSAATILVTASIMVAMLYTFRDHVVDDSYITYRYSRHLMLGLGVVWNPGEPPVEGYSNFLWMLAHAVGMRLSADPLVLSRVLGACAYAGCGFMVFRLARVLGAPFRGAALAAILFSLMPSFALWTTSGLETISVVLFSLLFFHALAAEWPTARRPWRTVLWGVALVLSRLDGLLIVGVALAVHAFPSPARRTLGWGWPLASLALPVVFYHAWRLVTFGTLIPNTLSAKLEPLSGLVAVTDFVAAAFPLLLPLAVLAHVRGLGPVERSLLVLCAAYVLAALSVKPQVSHAHRFFLPALGPLLALWALLAREAPVLGPSRGRDAGWLAVVLVAVWAVSPIFRLAHHASLEATSLRQAHMVVAQALRRTFEPSELLAASDCGLIPYVSGMRTLDLWGLNDRVIATQGFSAARVMAARPEVIVLNSLHPDAFQGREYYDEALYPVVAADSSFGLVDRRPLAGYTLWVFSTRPLR